MTFENISVIVLILIAFTVVYYLDRELKKERNEIIHNQDHRFDRIVHAINELSDVVKEKKL